MVSKLLGWAAACALFAHFGARATADEAERRRLVEAVASEDPARQLAAVESLGESSDAAVMQALSAWRQGGLFLYQTNGTTTAFLFDGQADATGRAKAVRVTDGGFLSDGSGVPLLLAQSDFTAADTTSGLRRAIKTVLDLAALSDGNPKVRSESTIKLGQEQNQAYLPRFKRRMQTETVAEVKRALEEAVAMTELASTNRSERLAAVRRIGGMRSINALATLKEFDKKLKAAPAASFDREVSAAAAKALRDIDSHIATANFFGTAFRGLSLSAVLLVAALGLAITFGLMGVINMAHGEIMMIGAYTAFVTQNLFKGWFGASGRAVDLYFPAALALSFASAGLVGLILERGVIRFLYKRPLESLLATWGVSLVLQQVVRSYFGPANVQVNSPAWLSGSFVVSDVLLAYNRLFVIGFAFFVVLLTYGLLTRTSLGLQIRAVMQNRAMAAAVGVRTDRVNMMTFAFGSGLAGMAGACLSQLANVGPSLGQNYIVDCFMVVVLGGVGNIVGTISAACGIGVTDQVLQPWLGAVMGKITVLGAIILFLQWRPAGIFVTRSRSLEG